VLEGRLGDFTLPDILRLLAFTTKSGRLWVTHEGTQARVGVLEGRIRDASADTSGLGLARRLLGQELIDGETLDGVLTSFETMPTDLELARHLVEGDLLDAGVVADLAREQVIDALFALLRWPDGAFRFEAQTAEQRGPSVLDLALTVDDALDEVERRVEAHAAVEERTGSPESVVTIRRPGRERAEVGLSPEGWTLLALVDGHRTVADLVRLSGQGAYRTRRTLASLLDEGIVAVGDAAEPPPAERLVRAHRTLASHEARLGDRDVAGQSEPTPVEPSIAVGQPPAASVVPTQEPAPSEPSTPTAQDLEVDVPGEQAADDAPEDVAPKEDEAATAASQRLTAQPGAAVAGKAGDARPPTGVTPLRARANRPQLRTDPEIDEDLVQRLIDGVESL
jgi:hypothetical protein